MSRYKTPLIRYIDESDKKETENIMSKITAIIFDGKQIEKILKFSTIDCHEEKTYNKKGNDNVVK